jgi:hypothetical protein
MTLDIFREKGTPLDRQVQSWQDLVQPPYSKLDDDAFTRVRAIFMNGIESEAIRFSHACARMNGPLQPILAEVRRAEQLQQTQVNWLHPADQDPLETTLGFEQVAIEVTASVARNEPDPYLKEVYDFGLLEDFDHLYRYSALYDRLYGRDPNALLQSYTDIVPGRPTSVEHRHPLDDLRLPYDRTKAAPLTKIHATAIMAAEHQTHDYYMTIGPMFADPLARQLYAEIAAIEEQHVTQYESIIDPGETWLEKWLLHEATEVWAYWSCAATETSQRIRAVYERFLSYELGHLHLVMNLMRDVEGRDPEELLPSTLPTPIAFESHRGYVRDALLRGAELRADGPRFVPAQLEPPRSIERRDLLNASGSPSETVAAGYQYTTGGELSVLPPATVADLAPAAAIERVLGQALQLRGKPLRAASATRGARGETKRLSEAKTAARTRTLPKEREAKKAVAKKAAKARGTKGGRR